jgi:uracil-DNA glycosylase
VLEPPGLEPRVVVTIHPSAVLRAGDRRREMRAQLAADLATARDALRAGTG